MSNAIKAQARLLIQAGAKWAPNYKTDSFYNQYYVEQWEEANPDLAAIWPKLPYEAEILPLPAKYRSDDTYEPYYSWERQCAVTEEYNANQRWKEAQGVYDNHWLTEPWTETAEVDRQRIESNERQYSDECWQDKLTRRRNARHDSIERSA